MRPDLPAFPDTFLWGVSSSAYQIEGAVGTDGRGPSTWDTFSASPGRVRDGDTGAVAADHYHRYREDVALMKELGVGAYRFSVSWPRVLPAGHGAINHAGLDFYDRLVDELCASGIAPMATLFHWDTPQAVEDVGGWMNRDTAYRFADYARLLGERLGDRVRMWIPLNEPAVLTFFGYGGGAHAPGRTLIFDALPVAHHQHLAHGLAVRALRATGATSVGTANNHQPVWPASDSEVDRFAAGVYDTLVNDLFARPVLLGEYPHDDMANALPGPVAEDLEIIATPLDWYGVNYYRPALVGAPSGDGEPLVMNEATLPADLPFALPELPGYPLTDYGWPVVPSALTELLATLASRYGDALPPMYITENGCSYGDGPDADGRVADTRRIDYLDSHVRALGEAMAAGSDVRGYFVWSIMDNFEWAAGYSQRFGLVHIDYATLARTRKDSFYWYRELIKAQR